MICSISQGALSATPLIFIIPSACFLKLSPGRWFQGENLVASVLVLIGFFVMITGLIMTGLYPQDCSHGVEMFYCADANISVTTPPAWSECSPSAVKKNAQHYLHALYYLPRAKRVLFIYYQCFCTILLEFGWIEFLNVLCPNLMLTCANGAFKEYFY